RELICATGNPDLFPELKIPKSTLRGWLRGECTAPSALPHCVRAVALRGILHFVDYSESLRVRTELGSESVTQTEIDLYSENVRLRKRVRVLQAVMCLLLVLVRVTVWTVSAYQTAQQRSDC
ncbi:MAG TPA: hypothetical protein VKP30_29840, partial [Polyangiaceae bacterium]|nr:hypothetical protein [Polyangiaceae bacterium]